MSPVSLTGNTITAPTAAPATPAPRAQNSRNFTALSVSCSPNKKMATRQVRSAAAQAPPKMQATHFAIRMTVFIVPLPPNELILFCRNTHITGGGPAACYIKRARSPAGQFVSRVKPHLPSARLMAAFVSSLDTRVCSSEYRTSLRLQRFVVPPTSKRNTSKASARPLR